MQTLSSLLLPTSDDVWKVYSSIHDEPKPLTEVRRSNRHIPTLRFYGALMQLEQDGLIKKYPADVLEVGLADVC